MIELLLEKGLLFVAGILGFLFLVFYFRTKYQKEKKIRFIDKKNRIVRKKRH